MPRPLLPGEVSPKVTERLHEGKASGKREAACSTTSQSRLRLASSPGRGAIGRPGKFCCSLGPNWAQSTGSCPHWQRHLYYCYESRQRSPVVPGSEKLRSSSTTITDSPGVVLPLSLFATSPSGRRESFLQGELSSASETERLYYMTRFRFTLPFSGRLFFMQPLRHLR